ncbi:hypothetical protein PDESU_01411 [Pontiella desulfatans]|uniref:Ig-like domain-containing protein n=1 Tax=Pontiella desulfatans TaxID=2750659 RepID=A0A6C2TZ12_PONDE|nr:hypothetical protein [Pontiella desulfatans]VGO12857.1 hypothetical protein PDESU_01411 [Pontiella desulfatans]
MPQNLKQTLLLIIALATLAASSMAEDLRAYYEKQKAEFAPLFNAPALGTEVSFKMLSGQERKGILMKLAEDELSVMNETGTTVSIKRTALHESARAVFFAEDFAHVMALEKTQEYKQQLHIEGVAEEQANTHDGRISVIVKSDKSVDKDTEEDENENEKTGATTTTTTTTRSQTEVVNLRVTVANNTTHSDTYTLEWYFFGESVVKMNSRNGEKTDEEKAAGKVTIFDGGTRKVTVGARARNQETIASKAFVVEKVTVETERSNSDHSGDPRVTESGTESAGWLVLLKYGGTIMDKKASSRKFMEDEWMGQLRLP